MSAAVKPQEVADLIRQTAELQHELVVLRTRLRAVPGPLATVAAATMEAVEDCYEKAAESLREAAPVVTLVTLD